MTDLDFDDRLRAAVATIAAGTVAPPLATLERRARLHRVRRTAVLAAAAAVATVATAVAVPRLHGGRQAVLAPPSGPCPAGALATAPVVGSGTAGSARWDVRAFTDGEGTLCFGHTVDGRPKVADVAFIDGDPNELMVEDLGNHWTLFYGATPDLAVARITCTVDGQPVDVPTTALGTLRYFTFAVRTTTPVTDFPPMDWFTANGQSAGHTG